MVVMRGRRGLAVGISALTLVAATTLPILLSRANDPPVPATSAVDPVTTASVDKVSKPPVQVVVPQLPGPSSGFEAALALLADGDRPGAFEAARALSDPVERRALQWAAIYFGNGEIPARSVMDYASDAPEFVVEDVFKTRIEEALVREKPAAKVVIDTLGEAMPSTVAGQIALAQAYLAEGQSERAGEVARAIWTQDFLDRATEAKVLAAFGDLLDAGAHWDRAVHLMMHDRASGVERLMKFLSPAQKSLAVARNAVSRNAKNAKKLLDSVDPSMTSHPVYLFSRAQRARQFELWDDAIGWLDKAKGTPPDAAEFWYERRTLTRQLLALGEIKRAYQASAGFSEGPDGRLVDAQFHAGWIALSFLRDAKAAVPHFELMAQNATLPDSVTQANYWLGRAQAAAGNDEAARAAYERAAAFGTIYYGQLARAELGQRSVELRPMPDWQAAEAAFEAREVVQAVRLLADGGHKEMAAALLRGIAERFTDGADLLLSARLAQQLGSHHLAIAIADTAEKGGVPLDLFSFPKDGLPAKRLAAIDHAAVYAITRQESRFQVDAISSAGARGLMQLMPATAKETAGKLGVAYSMARLTTDAEYNALLGSTYLKAQLERFDGSLVLAAAAYNAGGGNANKWIRLFGDPRSDSIDPVVWIELIPVQETRTYVKRVLGNYLVYRARLGGDQIDIEQALRKIPG